VASRDSIVQQIARVSRRERDLIACFRGDASPMNADSDQMTALLAAARALDGASIRYALIGGIAVGVHSGTPRATLDVDLAALQTAGRAAVVSALVGTGFHVTGEFPHSVNFRHAHGEPVQVAFDPDFDARIFRAERFDVGGVSVCIVTRDDLVAMKERAAADPAPRKSKRLRDQADVELLRGDVPDPDEGW
jgi:hypothetical protein